MEVVVSAVLQLLRAVHHRFLDPDPPENATPTMPSHARDTHHWTCGDGDSKPSVQESTHTQDRTAHTEQLELGCDSECPTVHINQLDLKFHRTLRFNWCIGCNQERSSLTLDQVSLSALPRMACSSRTNQKLDVVLDCSRISNFSKRHDLLKLVIRVRQVVHSTSTMKARIVCRCFSFLFVLYKKLSHPISIHSSHKSASSSI